MSVNLTPRQLEDLRAYSRGALSAIDLRRLLDDATYGDILSLLSAEHLALPRAPEHGREEHLARARAWLFPAHGPSAGLPRR